MEREKYPRVAFRILTWFCPGYLSEGIEGDLLEQFEEDRIRVGVKAAKRRFIWNTLKFFKPGIILRNKFSVQIINTIMLRSYFKITYRNILKNKGYSFIQL
jgi:putative ABC transport system permease protein